MSIAITFIEVLWRATIYHLLPALILSLTILLFVLGVIKLLKINDASLRGILFLVALLKPIFVLIRGTFPLPYSIDAPLAINLQLPDPMNLIPAYLWHIEFHPGKLDIYLTDTNMRVSLILLVVAAAFFLCWRWRSYYLFCRGLNRQSLSTKDEKGQLAETLDRLRAKVPASVRLHVSRAKYESPFSIGVRAPLVVFPAYILDKLNAEEREAVLLHELVHIQQKDTLKQWIPVILKDFLLFSPFAHFSFAKICLEREKKVDALAAKSLNESQALASALLKTAKLMTGQKEPIPMSQSLLAQKFLKPGKTLTDRVKPLIDFKPQTDMSLSWGKRVLIGIIVFLLLYPQLFVHIRALFYKIQIF